MGIDLSRLSWLRPWTQPLAVLGIVVLATLFVRNREQLAVARANLQRYTDSVSVALQHDSVAQLKADSALRAQVLAWRAKAETAAQGAARAQTASDHAARALPDAKTARDTIAALDSALRHERQAVALLGDALRNAEAENAAHVDREAQLEQQLAALHRVTADLVTKLQASNRSTVFSGTSWKLVGLALMVKGGVDILRGR